MAEMLRGRLLADSSACPLACLPFGKRKNKGCLQVGAPRNVINKVLGRRKNKGCWQELVIRCAVCWAAKLVAPRGQRFIP